MASYDVFTPSEVAIKMCSYLPDNVETLLEPSVGSGNLLNAMNGKYIRADVFDINQDYLDQIPNSELVHKTCGDFLTAEISTRYDAILMNPPYLRYQDMTSEQRLTLRNLSPILRSGNVDMYMGFLVKSLELLKETGRLVAIIPSAWRYTKSAKLFREWILSNRYISVLYDYGSTKVFKGINVYCCILVLTRHPNTQYILNETLIPYETESPRPSLQTLNDVALLQNGIATLCDSVFIHDAPLFEEPCWKPILKVSKHTIRSILYPYTEKGTIIPEDEFRKTNPHSYAYLQRNRQQLDNRDRGAKQYEAWYAFGRKQGILITDTSANSIYVSTLCAPTIPCFEQKTMLFYSGIRITPRNGITCKDIEESIIAARDKIVSLSSKRSSDWINLSTSVLKQVAIHL